MHKCLKLPFLGSFFLYFYDKILAVSTSLYIENTDFL